ncbi:MAG: primosomal protein N' [Clostridia bacterium]|nr:primosomal protein N' [Clostridia bacterium]
MIIAKVLINTSVKSLNKVYDYIVSEELLNDIQIGKRVSVSFGRGKNVEEGIVVKLLEETQEEVEKKGYKLKEILEVLDEVSYVDEERLKLAKYISYLYFCNVYDALKLMFPPGTASKNSSKSVHTKQDTQVVLIKSPDEIMQDIENNVIKSAKHIQLLTFLIYNDYVLTSDIIDGLGISRAVINTVVKNGYIQLKKVEKEVDLLKDYHVERTYAKTPTPEQKEVINKIGSYIYDEKYRQCLIFGVTGSGKTEVYLQLIEKVLNQGKKAIVLVPEISLTYQTVTRFLSRFGNNVAILHSKMTIAKRKEEYKRIKQGKVDIVIGARSAIFAPIDDLGLVIIDEEHDSSYYSQTTPKYSTKDIAAYICKTKDAVLVLGSATPEIITYNKAKNGVIDLFEMKTRPGVAILPKIELIDMRQERVMGNTSVLSSALKEEIKKNIENHEQTMIFLNRRGYTSYLSCKDCGYVFKCPNCDVSMTYHKTNNLLLCHYCSHVEKNISTCPQCESDHISSGVIGTQKLEEELQEIYSNISILRMDADTTVARDSHQKILDKFKSENINVLVGTQMISKGHDIANVTLVGILGVDALLSLNDYTASEKAFSNIYQVAGRAGRAELPGRVLIQTNDTANYILNSIEENDYEKFFDSEIEYRKTFGYPPFLDIVLFELIGGDFKTVREEAEKLYYILIQESSNEYRVFSPKSPYIQKLNNRYRVNIIMKTKLNTQIYNKIYEKIGIFNSRKKKNVSLCVSKNPTFIN